MKFLRAPDWATVFRLAGAGAAVVVAVVAAVGSGASETAEIVGGPLTPPQRVLAAMSAFAVFMLWERHSLQRKLYDHASSPRLTWSDPTAEMRPKGSVHLEVWCENTGPTESVAILRGGQAWSASGEQLVMPVAMGSPINSSKIDQQKHRWLVTMDSLPNVQFSTGTHHFTWSVVYFDNARPNTHGYLTQETLSVQFDGLGPGKIVGPYWLDATSTNGDRYRRYWKYMRDVEIARKRASAKAPIP